MTEEEKRAVAKLREMQKTIEEIGLQLMKSEKSISGKVYKGECIMRVDKAITNFFAEMNELPF